MPQTEANLTYRTSPDALYETFDSEIIIINMVSGSYYSLDATALGIWNLLQGQHSLQTIIAATQNAYQGDAEIIEAAVVAMVEDVESEGLLLRAGESEAAAVAAPGNNAAPDSLPVFQPPVVTKFTDMKELLLLDPIHEVDDMGWPHAKAEADGAAPQTDAPTGTTHAASG